MEKPQLILKITKVVPVLTAGDPSLIKNYRPVSILPAFSNNFEIIVYNCISRYLTENMILSNNWFCIRDNKCKLFLAEDTRIFYQNRNLKILMDYLNDEIRHVATWIKANKLFIRVIKTKIMIFRTKQKFLATRLLKIGNTIIEDFNVFTDSI